jgi:hypothetical protein
MIRSNPSISPDALTSAPTLLCSGTAISKVANLHAPHRLKLTKIPTRSLGCPCICTACICTALRDPNDTIMCNGRPCSRGRYDLHILLKRTVSTATSPSALEVVRKSGSGPYSLNAQPSSRGCDLKVCVNNASRAALRVDAFLSLHTQGFYSG